MKKIIAHLSLLFVFCFLLTQVSLADELSDLKNQVRILRTKIAELEKRLDQEEARRIKESETSGKKLSGGITVEKILHGAKRHDIEYDPDSGLEVAGLIVGVDGTFIFQGTPNANNAGDGEDSIFDASWTTDVEVEKVFSHWGLAFLHLEAGQGDGIEPELSVFSNVNRDAFSSTARIEATEFWYEHYFSDKHYAVAAGKMDPTVHFDQNEFANDETTQFLGHMFRNSPVIEFPSDNTLGFHAHINPEPISFLDLGLGYFNADADWDDIFDHGFYMAQLSIKTAELLGMDKEKWSGNCRFYTWVNDRNHLKLVNEGDEATTDTKELNYGFGLSADQMITDVFGVFTRFGWQRPNITLVSGDPTLEWSWSAGAQMTGKYWVREDDVLGFAIGQDFPSEEWKDSSSDNYGAAEGHIEAYYRAQLNQHLAVSPDIQIIWNPNGVSESYGGDNDTIFVYGARAQVDF